MSIMTESKTVMNEDGGRRNRDKKESQEEVDAGKLGGCKDEGRGAEEGKKETYNDGIMDKGGKIVNC